MPTDFTLPELGENITAGDVVRLLVKPGDRITKDQSVIELETDKATIEVPSSVAGTVKDIRVKVGDKVKVGQTILTVEEGAGEGAKGAEGAEGAKGAEGAGGKGAEGAKGAGAKGDDGAGASGANGANGAKGSRASGAQEVHAAHDADTDDGAAAGGEDDDEPAPEPARQKRGEVVDISRAPRGATGGQQPAVAASPESPAPAAAPSVRRMARELGVDIRQVSGSGPGGRITVDDLHGFVKQALASGKSGGGAAPAASPGQPLPDFSKWGEVERKPISSIRRKTAEHLGHAWNVIPHVTQHDRADITALEELRHQYGPQAERAGGKLTVTAIALKIVAGALRRFPQFASSIDPARGQVIYKKYVHIGVAVDTDRGLLVPVLRDVDTKGIVDLSIELAKASEKARAGKLSLDEMQGGVFTITNLGGIGGTSFTPIVNWPEVAILGVSRGSLEPLYDGKQFQPRLMLPLSLSYDHRMIDGADAARFLRWIAQAFEQPFVLAL